MEREREEEKKKGKMRRTRKIRRIKGERGDGHASFLTHYNILKLIWNSCRLDLSYNKEVT